MKPDWVPIELSIESWSWSNNYKKSTLKKNSKNQISQIGCEKTSPSGGLNLLFAIETVNL